MADRQYERQTDKHRQKKIQTNEPTDGQTDRQAEVQYSKPTLLAVLVPLTWVIQQGQGPGFTVDSLTRPNCYLS